MTELSNTKNESAFRLARSATYEGMRSSKDASRNLSRESEMSAEPPRRSGRIRLGRTSMRLTSRASSRRRPKRYGSLPQDDDELSTMERPAQNAPQWQSAGDIVGDASDAYEIPKAQLKVAKDALRYSPFGGRWSQDIFSLPHNGVRSELRDLSVLSRAIWQLGVAAEAEDVELFLSWWYVFEGFTVEYFDFEERVLFPYLITSTDRFILKDVSKAIHDLKRRALAELEKLDRAADEVGRGSLEHLERFNPTAIETFQASLCAYFEELETRLPPILEEALPPMFGSVIQTKLLEHLCASQRPGENVAILTYWLRNRPGVLQRWCLAHMSLATRMLYPRWKRRFEAHHKRKVTRLERRVSLLSQGPSPRHPK